MANCINWKILKEKKGDYMKYISKSVLALMILTAVCFASFSITDYSVSPQQVEPGGYGTINLVVSNIDPSNSVEGISIQITKTGSIEMQNEINIGDLSPSASVTLSIPFKVHENAQTGIYAFNIDIYGRAVTSGNNKQTLHKKVVASVKIVNPPALQLSLDNSELSDVSHRTILIMNDGGDAKNIYLSIESKGFGFADRDLVYTNTIKNSTSIPVTIDARDANEGSQKIEFKITYQDALGNEYTETRSIPIIVRKESGDFVFSQKEPVVTRTESMLKLKIINEGNDISNLRFSISDSEVQLIGISEFKIGDLKKGESKDIEVPILANAEPGSKSIKLNLKWIEQNENREGSKYIPLKISSDSDVGIYLEAKPSPLYANEEHTISITVSNLGSYPIEATTVSFGGEAFNMLSIQPQQYIGGLNKDDFSSVQYKIRIKDVEEGNYPVQVNVRYRDASGEWKTKKYETNIQISRKVEGEDNTSAYLIIAVIIVIAIAYWFAVRKRK